jgi:hypothetical protein
VEGLQAGEAARGTVSLTFRWLGVAGVELRAGSQILVIDPFFTRSTITSLWRALVPNTHLVAEKLPECHFALVTHAHYDHLMDVPAVLRHTGADAYGSANTCQLLRLQGITTQQVHEIQVNDHLALGNFSVEVIPGQHSPIPFGKLFNGRLRSRLKLPLHVQDYRMDVCLGFHITVEGERLLVCAREPQPADVLFAVAQEPKEYYLKLLQGAQPRLFVPIHWDNFTRPLSKPLSPFTRPGRMPLSQITSLARGTQLGVEVIIPQVFKDYPIR